MKKAASFEAAFEWEVKCETEEAVSLSPHQTTQSPR